MANIIFDFDGTIADSFDFIVDFLRRRKRITSLNEEEKTQLRGLSIIAVAQKLGHHRWSMVRLFFAGRRDMGKQISKVETVSGMHKIIQELKRDGHGLYIVSNNTAPNVRRFLKHHGLEEDFLEIYGNAWLGGKKRSIAKLIKKHNLKKTDTWYVGDEPNDIYAARSLMIKVIAVAWGFATLAAIASARPTVTAKKPSEILDYVRSAAAKLH